jgi:hypothetical protein
MKLDQRAQPSHQSTSRMCNAQLQPQLCDWSPGRTMPPYLEVRGILQGRWCTRRSCNRSSCGGSCPMYPCTRIQIPCVAGRSTSLSGVILGVACPFLPRYRFREHLCVPLASGWYQSGKPILRLLLARTWKLIMLTDSIY